MQLTGGFERLRLVDEEGNILVEPCLSVRLYAALSAQSLADENTDLLWPYQAFVEDFGGSLTWCYTDGNQSRPAPVTPARLACWAEQIAEARRVQKGMFFCDLRSGRRPIERLPPSLEVEIDCGVPPQRPHLVVVDLSLPLSWFELQGDVGVRRYLDRLLSRGFPLSSGLVGFGLAYNPLAFRDIHGPALGYWLSRHPGLVTTTTHQEAFGACDTLPDISWMTLLGPELCERAGGVQALQQNLSTIPISRIFPLAKGGAIVQIGDRPQLGDAETGDHLADYQRVGQTLATLRNAARMAEYDRPFGLSSEEDRLRWVNRFFPAAA
jgi:hypothetical protein